MTDRTMFAIIDMTLGLFPQKALKAMLAKTLRTRKKNVPVNFNGATTLYKRNDLRDYLREKMEGVK